MRVRLDGTGLQTAATIDDGGSSLAKWEKGLGTSIFHRNYTGTKRREQ